MKIILEYKYHILGILILAVIGYFALNYRYTVLSFDDFRFANYDAYDVGFEEFTGTPAPVDLDSNQFGRTMRTVITEEAKSGPNFANRFTFVEWGCGSGCQNSVVIDTTTGKIFDGVGAMSGYDFRPDSNLLIVNPIQNIVAADNNATPNWLATEYFKWVDNHFEYLTSFKLINNHMVPVKRAGI